MDEGGGQHQLQVVEKTFGGGPVHKCRFTYDKDHVFDIRTLTKDNVIKMHRTHGISAVIDLMRPHTDGYPKIEIPYADPGRVDWIIRHFTNTITEVVKGSGGHEHMRYDRESLVIPNDALMAKVYNYAAYLCWLQRKSNFELMTSRGWGFK